MLLYSIIFALLGSAFYILWIRYIVFYFISLSLNFHLIKFVVNRFLFALLFSSPFITISIVAPIFGMIFCKKAIQRTLTVEIDGGAIIAVIWIGIIFMFIHFYGNLNKALGPILKSRSNEEALTKLDAIPIEQIYENFNEKPLLQKCFRLMLGFRLKDHPEIIRLMQQYPKQALPVRVMLASYRRHPYLPRRKFEKKSYFYGFM